MIQNEKSNFMSFERPNLTGVGVFWTLCDEETVISILMFYVTFCSLCLRRSVIYHRPRAVSTYALFCSVDCCVL